MDAQFTSVSMRKILTTKKTFLKILKNFCQPENGN